jgi:hypothetical protein
MATARLCEELLALTREFSAAVEAGDESRLTAFVERRTALAAAIGASPEPPDRAAVRALLDCDRALIALLVRSQHAILRRLADLAVGRRALETYLDGAAPGSAYIERVG